MINWAAEGKLHPPKITTFPFEKVSDAHRSIESGSTVGKLVLVFDDNK